ncbi:MAG TPA: ubiquitin carboxyl-terminal hydrolase family protein [Roseiflexaceae bacterium]|nr:ubiquitin carboxyl-terminal hydrolase family protein [Roseiflexaceae bacterium]
MRRKPLATSHRPAAPQPGVPLSEANEAAPEPAASRLLRPDDLLALQRSLGNRATGRLVQRGRAAQPSLHTRLQRVLSVRFGTDTTYRQLADADSAYNEVETLLDQTGKTELLAAWRTKKTQAIQILDEWIKAPKARQQDTSNSQQRGAQHALTRAYEDPADLASAVLGRVGSLPNIAIEEAMAEQTMRSEHVRSKLQEFLSVNVPSAMSLPHLGLIVEQQGRYLPFLADGQKKIADIIDNPSEETLAILLAAIHDITDILYEDHEFGGHDLTTIPPEKYKGTTLKQNELGKLEAVRTPLSANFRGTSATPNEKDPHIQAANQLGHPVSMGPSRTAGRLMMFAEACRADKQTKEALAWALFAFWYKAYRRDLTDIHRFHFTLDMAANFGVDYDPMGTPTLNGRSMLPDTSRPAKPKDTSSQAQPAKPATAAALLKAAIIKKIHQTRANIKIDDYRKLNKIKEALNLDPSVNLQKNDYTNVYEELVTEEIIIEGRSKNVLMPAAKYLETLPPLAPSQGTSVDQEDLTKEDDRDIDYASSDSEDEFDFDEQIQLNDYAKQGYIDPSEVPPVPSHDQIVRQVTGTYFGTELTFTCPEMLIPKPSELDKTELKKYYQVRRLKQKGIVNQKQRQWVAQLEQELEQHNPYGATIKPKRKRGKSGNTIYRVKFTNIPELKSTWWFDIDVDVPCIELATRRMTVEQARILAPIIQSYIFDFAKTKVGLTPHSFEGGGHIHIDLMTGFQNNQYKLLNFMTEIHNLGIWPFLDLGFMKKVAPPLSAQPEVQKRYSALLEEAKKQQFQGWSLSKIINSIQKDVYGGTGDDKTVHNQMLGVRSYELRQEGLRARWRGRRNRAPKETDFLKISTVENRAHRGQNSHQELMAILHLYQQRLKVTSGAKLTDPQPIELPMKQGFPDYPGETAEHQQTWTTIAQRIAAYFDETPDVYLEDYLPSFSHLPKGLIKQIQGFSTKKKPAQKPGLVDPSSYKLPDTHNPPKKNAKQVRDRLISGNTTLQVSYLRNRRQATASNVDYHLGDIEHIYNSCYVASLLTMFANTPAYQRLFDPQQHEVTLEPEPVDLAEDARQGNEQTRRAAQQQGQALQQGNIAELLTALRNPAHMITGEQVEQVIATLGTLGMLVPRTVVSNPLEDQQDAAEILQKMLTVLRPNADMQIQEQSQIKRPGEQFTDSAATTPQSMLQLPIEQPGIGSLEQALEHYCATERVEFGQGTALKRMRLKALPRVLTIALRRFLFHDGTALKISKKVTAPVLLTIPGVCLHEDIADRRFVYRLASFVHHSGTYAGGHYTAYTRSQDGRTQKSDDITGPSVPGLQETKRDKDTAYLYVYELVNPEQLDPRDAELDQMDRRADQTSAEERTREPEHTVDYNGLPAVGTRVISRPSPKSAPMFYRVLSKGELLSSLPTTPVDAGLEDNDTAVFDGKVFLTDQEPGKRFNQVVRETIDKLMFASGRSYAQEFARGDDPEQPNEFTQQELGQNNTAGHYARLYKLIQSIGYQRDKQLDLLKTLMRQEGRRELKALFLDDIARKISYRGRVAEHIQKLIISLIEQLDEGKPSLLGLPPEADRHGRHQPQQTEPKAKTQDPTATTQPTQPSTGQTNKPKAPENTTAAIDPTTSIGGGKQSKASSKSAKPQDPTGDSAEAIAKKARQQRTEELITQLRELQLKIDKDLIAQALNTSPDALNDLSSYQALLQRQEALTKQLGSAKLKPDKALLAQTLSTSPNASQDLTTYKRLLEQQEAHAKRQEVLTKQLGSAKLKHDKALLALALSMSSDPSQDLITYRALLQRQEALIEQIELEKLKLDKVLITKALGESSDQSQDLATYRKLQG